MHTLPEILTRLVLNRARDMQGPQHQTHHQPWHPTTEVIFEHSLTTVLLGRWPFRRCL